MRVVAFATVLTLSLHVAFAEEPSVRLLFWDAEDIAESFGDIRFGAEVLENEGRADGYPDMQYGCEVPRVDGAAWIYGWRIRNWSDPQNRAFTSIR